MTAEPITIQSLTTIAGLTIATIAVVFLVQRPLNLSGTFMDRFGALLSVLVAIILAVVAGVVLGLVAGADIFQDVLNGLVAGLAASGSYDVINGAGKASSNPPGS